MNPNGKMKIFQIYLMISAENRKNVFSGRIFNFIYMAEL